MTTQNSSAPAAATITLPSEREIRITRLFNAPRDLVFKAHTDPVLITRWWGPRSTTTVVEAMDVRPGGAWRFIQRTDDGREFVFSGEFREVAPPERLVQTFEFSGAPGHVVLETMTFEERGGTTFMTVIDQFDTKEDRDAAVASGMESGARESYERLSELAERIGPDGPKELVITRIFDAPRALVWKAWTDPQVVMRWWGPKDYTAPVAKIDFRVGGKYLFAMRSPEGQDFYSTGVYQKIDPLNEIVYTDSFADAEGNVISPAAYGFADDFPRESEVTVTFEDDDGKTRMTVVTSRPAGVIGEYAYVGWNESLDKMAASLK